jgi:hypothetical protein
MQLVYCEDNVESSISVYEASSSRGAESKCFPLSWEKLEKIV